MSRSKIYGLAALAVFLLIAAGAWFLTSADRPEDDWRSYNRTLTGERFADLAEINTRNVSNL